MIAQFEGWIWLDVGEYRNQSAGASGNPVGHSTIKCQPDPWREFSTIVRQRRNH